MDRQQWCQRLFESIDAKRTREFVSYLTPDARFRFGSAPAVQGETAIIQAVDRFFASVASLSHRVLDLWEMPGHVICRGEVRYQRLDGTSVQVPFCDVLVLRGDKIAHYEIYLDPTPLAPG
jgi:ketosteroid isomerase-like protein